MRRFLPIILLTAGCAGPLDGAGRALDAVSIIATKAEPVMEAQYSADQKACLDLDLPAAETCVAHVRAAWKPVKAAYRSTRAAWLTADAALHTAEALAAIGKPPNVPEVLAAVASAIAAADAYRSAVSAAGGGAK